MIFELAKRLNTFEAIVTDAGAFDCKPSTSFAVIGSFEAGIDTSAGHLAVLDNWTTPDE